ncbi:MAG: GNAT family N-acetyltransferase, partial [Acidobacteria bacterium]|nr:GNAT family N-acetyltransferase [Acidobacteriota bacterium]
MALEGLRSSDGAAVTLRPATGDDRELLLRIYASTREEELAAVPWEPAAKAAFLRLQGEAQDAYYREQIVGCEFLVVVVAGGDAGRLYLDRRADEHRLVDIALLPEVRGCGVGTVLLRALMAEAAAAG